MKDFILLLVVVVLLAPSGLSSATSVGDNYDYPLAEGVVAMQSANTDFSSANLPGGETVSPTPICGCNGTGYVMSGDGIERIKCVCGDKCKCKKPNDRGQVGDVVQVSPYRCYYFTAPWCGPCQRFKENGIPTLVKLGWKFVEDEWNDSANVVVVNIDKNPTKFAELREPSQELIPTFVITKNDKVLARHVGSIDAGQFSKWYNDVITADKAKK